MRTILESKYEEVKRERDAYRQAILALDIFFSERIKNYTEARQLIKQILNVKRK